MVERDAAADMWFKLTLGVGGHPGSSDGIYKRTGGATVGQMGRFVRNYLLRLELVIHLCWAANLSGR